MPLFLSISHVLAIHANQINLYGGLPGVRDKVLLESAVAMPEQTFDTEYLHRDIFEMAAAYLFHLVQNHPFIDGNKRVGAVAAIIFLENNGYEIEFSEEQFEQIILDTACGSMSKPVIASFFREHCRLMDSNI